MGLWHGANWTFLLWGIYHVIIILFYRFISNLNFNLNSKLRNIIGVMITLPIMMLGWIPFRAMTSSDAIQMWLKIFDYNEYNALGMRENTYLIAFILLVGIILTNFIKNNLIPSLIDKGYTNTFISIQSIFFAFTLPFIFIFLKPVNQFIYFQF